MKSSENYRTLKEMTRKRVYYKVGTNSVFFAATLNFCNASFIAGKSGAVTSF